MVAVVDRRVGKIKRHIPFYFLARHLKYRLWPKELEYRLIARNLGRYAGFVDVGANLGMYTYLFQRSGGSVTAFEPNPVLYEYLTAMLERRVNLINAAVSSSTDRISLYVPVGEMSSGRSSVEPGVAAEYSPELIEFDVPSVLLDDALHISDGRYLVKIDVEGHELHVLHGFRRTLASGAQIDLMVEVDARHNPKATEVFSFMSQLGYSAYCLDGSVRRVCHSALANGVVLRRADAGGRPVDNFLFSRDDLQQELVS